VAKLKGQGGGALFIKSHPKSKNLWVDAPLNPDPKISSRWRCSTSTTSTRATPCCRSPSGRDIKDDGAKRVVQPEYNKAGDEVWFSVWSAKNKQAPSWWSTTRRSSSRR
jgi:nitrite reductase (NO-forming)/hydroxylamine reductase